MDEWPFLNHLPLASRGAAADAFMSAVCEVDDPADAMGILFSSEEIRSHVPGLFAGLCVWTDEAYELIALCAALFDDEVAA